MALASEMENLVLCETWASHAKIWAGLGQIHSTTEAMGTGRKRGRSGMVGRVRDEGVVCEPGGWFCIAGTEMR